MKCQIFSILVYTPSPSSPLQPLIYTEQDEKEFWRAINSSSYPLSRCFPNEEAMGYQNGVRFGSDGSLQGHLIPKALRSLPHTISFQCRGLMRTVLSSQAMQSVSFPLGSPIAPCPAITLVWTNGTTILTIRFNSTLLYPNIVQAMVVPLPTSTSTMAAIMVVSNTPPPPSTRPSSSPLQP